MNNRKKQIVNLVIKMTILIFLHLVCNYAIAYWGIYVKWSPKLYFSRMEYLVQELLFMTIFQLFIYINYRIKRLTITKYKIIYIITNLLFLLLTFLFWCVIIVGPLWLPAP